MSWDIKIPKSHSLFAFLLIALLFQNRGLHPEQRAEHFVRLKQMTVIGKNERLLQ